MDKLGWHGGGHETLLFPSLTRAACVPLVWNFWLDGSRSFRWSATVRCPRVFDDIEIRISLLRTYYRRIWSHIVLSEFKFDSFGLVESSVMEISRTMRNVTSIPRTIVKFDSKRGNKNASVDQLAQGRVLKDKWFRDYECPRLLLLKSDRPYF